MTLCQMPETILALESSCDETACAIVRRGRVVVAHTLMSQIETHRLTGGVVPEVAAREHMLHVNTVIEQTLTTAGLGFHDVDAYAATLGPGLVGSLLAGVTTAKTLSLLTQRPFIGVHHLMGHVCSVLLEPSGTLPPALCVNPPMLCLLVSGGHTQLLWLKGFHPLRLQVLGTSLDDAVGEAYDKVARMMGLPYPGGPQIDTLAHHACADATRFHFPVAQTQNPLDFSFSGLKTAVRRVWEQQEPKVTSQEAFDQLQRDIAASFQACMTHTLIQRLTKALAWVKAHEASQQAPWRVAIVGGVAANQGLRQALVPWAEIHDVQLTFPEMHYCSDNAAMIGSAAYFAPIPVGAFATEASHPFGMDVFPRMPLSALSDCVMP
ncbi:MAG: tRNA (adenosine(37)-N6)-threonylcarbamoyltransferase complex transferase subunit TsaD [Vampirovibrionales bacterium]